MLSNCKSHRLWTRQAKLTHTLYSAKYRAGLADSCNWLQRTLQSAFRGGGPKGEQLVHLMIETNVLNR